MARMEIIHGIYSLKPRHKGCVLTVGNFDGVHHGHRMLLDHLFAKAKELKVPSMLLTFEPLPREFFAGEKVPARLTRFREKISLLCETPLDRVLCLPFNERTRNTPADWVINVLLTEMLGIRYIVVGDDFRFGKNQQGDYAMLKTAGDRHGFGVSHLGTLKFEHERVSSSRIRGVLAEGDFVLAEKLLALLQEDQVDLFRSKSGAIIPPRLSREYGCLGSGVLSRMPVGGVGTRLPSM